MSERVLSGRVVLVTGASRGIGRATALELAGMGANVFGTSRTEDGVKDIAEMLAPFGGGAIQLDLLDRESFQDRLDTVAQGAGAAASILVHNGGITLDAPFLAMHPGRFDGVMDTNVRGPFELTRRWVSGFGKACPADARAIFISSIVGIDGNPGQANYGASKAALNSLVRTLASELGGYKPERWNGTVNGIAPGFIQTAMTDGLKDEIVQTVVERTASRRLGTPEDVARVVGFLALPASDFINGQVFRVDGGIRL